MVMMDPHFGIEKEVPDAEVNLDGAPTVSIDLVYLYETGEKPTLVAVDHDTGRV